MANKKAQTKTYKLDKPKSVVLESLVKAAKGNIVQNDHFEIKVGPSFSSPFAPTGILKIQLTSNTTLDGTELLCGITPTASIIAPYFLVIPLLVIWTLFFWPFDRNNLVVMLCGWVMMLLLLYALPLVNKANLERYATELVKKVGFDSGSLR